MTFSVKNTMYEASAVGKIYLLHLSIRTIFRIIASSQFLSNHLGADRYTKKGT